MLTYSYTVLIYSWLLDKYHSQFIEYQENKQPWKISERKMCEYTKYGAFHIGILKNRVIVEKGGQLHTWQRWKMGHLARTSVLWHI